jgi:hypothetical protein
MTQHCRQSRRRVRVLCRPTKRTRKTETDVQPARGADNNSCKELRQEKTDDEYNRMSDSQMRQACSLSR